MCAIAVTANTPLFSSPKKFPSLLFKSSLTSSSSSLSPSPPRSISSPRIASLSPSPSTLRPQTQLIQDTPVVDTVLKRKRPAKIDVPILSVCFAVESSPKGERMDVMEEEGDGYSVYCKRGKRGRAMEDRYSAKIDIDGDARQAFFGVFDGHGGAKVSEFAAKNMGKNVMDQVMRRNEGDVEEAIKDGFLMTDREVLHEGINGGACCTAALIRNGDLVVSNVGDCRAVMSRGGKAEALTSDHRPNREDERNRIENSGGFVDYCRGVWRIQGSLAVSRAIGDQHLKEWVISEPETKTLKIENNCNFLILASDGLWDKVTNQEAVDIVQPLCVGLEKPKLYSACKKLADLSISRGSVDDTSVMIINLACFV